MLIIGCPKFTCKILASFSILAVTCPGALADGQPNYITNDSQVYSQFDLGPVNNSVATSGAVASSGASGVMGNHTSAAYIHSDSAQTGKQTAVHLITRTAQLDKVFGGGRGGLPPTVLDSFVRTAGGSADQIYGDEGSDGPPPFSTFDSSHRIERGIHSGGLTTGHQSGLPEAWGWPQ